MTTAATAVMAVSVATIVVLFLFCITKVIFSPAVKDED